MKPYIDKSTNEKGEKEISIHGLSEPQFKIIQFLTTKSGAAEGLKSLQITPFDPLYKEIDYLLKTIKEFSPNA